MTKKNIVVAICGDHHTNSIVGLCPPRFHLEEGEYKSSKAQRWLWRNWLDYVQQVEQTAAKHNAKIISVLNGDMCDGDHHGTAQIISRSRVIQQRLVYDTLKPLIEISNENYVVIGTGAHSGKSGYRDEMLAEDIDAVKVENGNYAHWLLRLNINGVRLNIRHHGTMGRLPWTRSNSLKRLAVETVFNCTESGEPIPNLIIQSHRHVYADTRDEFKNIRVIAMPAWQLATEFVHRIAPGSLASIGGLIVTCFANGEYELKPVLYKAQQVKEYRIV